MLRKLTNVFITDCVQVFFSALVDVAGHSKNIDNAFSILDSMKKEGIKPKAVVYSSLMGVCSNVSHQSIRFALKLNIETI